MGNGGLSPRALAAMPGPTRNRSLPQKPQQHPLHRTQSFYKNQRKYEMRDLNNISHYGDIVHPITNVSQYFNNLTMQSNQAAAAAAAALAASLTPPSSQQQEVGGNDSSTSSLNTGTNREPSPALFLPIPQTANEYHSSGTLTNPYYSDLSEDLSYYSDYLDFQRKREVRYKSSLSLLVLP
jgi:hypothetical protein